MASKEVVIPPEQTTTPPVLTKDKTEENVPRPERSSSPDENCSICLNQFENQSFTDQCFHKFCFVCILEWSKVKAVCPLCKTAFKSIIHNIVSNEIYDQYHLQPNAPATEEHEQEVRRFRYRTTVTDDHRYAWERQRNHTFLQLPHENSRFYMTHHEDRRRLRIQNLRRSLEQSIRNNMRLQNQRNAAYNFRRYIYGVGSYVKQTRFNRFSGYRDISLGYFQRNPAAAYRFVPWLQRDLGVIFNGDQNHVLFVTELILSLIQRIDIQTYEFRNSLEGFLLSKTDHFVHEFINFARSPYDVTTYDQMAQYNTSRPSEPPPVDINEPLLVISSDSDTDVILDLSSHSREEVLPTAFPLLESDINVIPGTSGSSSNTQNQMVKQEKKDTTEINLTNELSDVEIIGYLPPYRERTPVVVTLSSDTEEDEQPTCRKCGQPKHTSKCKKIKRKPKNPHCMYSAYQSSSAEDFSRSSQSRSRSRSRPKSDRVSSSRDKSVTKKLISTSASSSSSGNYSSDTEDYSKDKYNKSKSRSPFEKYDSSATKHCKSSNTRSYKKQRRSRSRSAGFGSRSRSRSRSRSISHIRQMSPFYKTSRDRFRSRSRSGSRSQRTRRSRTRSRSRDKEATSRSHTRSHERDNRHRSSTKFVTKLYWSDECDQSAVNYRQGDNNKHISNRESIKRHRSSERRSSSRSRSYRSSSSSKSKALFKRKYFQKERSKERSVGKIDSSKRHKQRSKEKQEARRKRREKRQLEKKKKAAGVSKDLIVIDLTESADEKARNREGQEMIDDSLLFEEEVGTVNQVEHNLSFGQTSDVGPMRAMLLEDVTQTIPPLNVVDPSLDAVDEIFGRSGNQSLEPIQKTAFDLMIEAERMRLQEMFEQNPDLRRDAMKAYNK
ncbi:uncharacterized protein [Antedon mediterranea]|uniref:uncharacterized protein n=1 Tax=Antedon mediterranea TaxID=105859 RepID=UPI003AF7CD4F